MIDEDNFTIETVEEIDAPTEQVRRFPVVTQLSILGLILVVLLGLNFIPKIFADRLNDIKDAPDAPLANAQQANTVIDKIEDVKIEAKSAYVYDVRTKKALYSKNADDIRPLASITKLMTTLVAKELINENKTVSVSKSAIMQSGASGLGEGEQITAQSLSDYAILASSNDAAFALAAAVGGIIDKKQPTGSFVSAMNIRAEELGLPHLKFLNPTGLDESETKSGADGTAREISFLLEYILANHPEILEPSTMASALIYNEAGAYHQAENTNPVINKIPNLLGSKTGYTDLAGGNLTIAFDAGYNRPIIVTVLGSSYEGRFTDVVTLVKAVKEAMAKNI